MPDPNARRDKALEDIARELRETNKHLKRIADSGRRLTFTNNPPDPFEVAEQAKPTDPSVHSTNPYFNRSKPSDVDNTGPYGTSSPRPYE